MATAKKSTTKKKTAPKKEAPVIEEVKEVSVAEEVKEEKVVEKVAPVDSRDAEIEALKEQVKALMEQIANQPKAYAPERREMVTFLWQAPVSDENRVEFGDRGEYGQVTGKTGTFSVPKDELSRVLTANVWLFLKKRWLLVISGLTEEERELYGVNYKNGEVLDRKAFEKMLDLGADIIPIYKNLCNSHKEIVAKRFYEGWASGKKRIDRDVLIELRNLSKGIDADVGAFQRILEEMNAKEEKN